MQQNDASLGIMAAQQFLLEEALTFMFLIATPADGKSAVEKGEEWASNFGVLDPSNPAAAALEETVEVARSHIKKTLASVQQRVEARKR